MLRSDLSLWPPFRARACSWEESDTPSWLECERCLASLQSHLAPPSKSPLIPDGGGQAWEVRRQLNMGLKTED